MANFSPGNTVDMAEMRDNLGMPGGTVTLSGIKNQFYDAYWNTSLQPYAAFQTSGLWRYRLEISIPGAGFVQFTYPYSSAQGNQVTSLWFNALNYNYMSIYCQPYYPYTFQYWGRCCCQFE